MNQKAILVLIVIYLTNPFSLAFASRCNKAVKSDQEFHVELRQAEKRIYDYVYERLQAKPKLTTERFSVIEIIPKVYFLRFETQRDLAMSFLRFQEYYESPKYKGQVFSRTEFKQYYKSVSETGKFTYLSDWGGFNIPSKVLTPFYEGKFPFITEREKAILDLFKDKKGAFYLIGGFKENTKDKKKALFWEAETIIHELAHALYYFDPVYHEKVERVLNNTSQAVLNELKQWLMTMGHYHKEVIRDEQHAYLATNWSSFDRNEFDPMPAFNSIKALIKNLETHTLKHHGR